LWGFLAFSALVMIVLSFPALVTGETFYVANDGDDEGTGTSPGEAWQTLAKVSDSTFQAGDSILLNRGDEWYEALEIPSSGTVENPIVVGNYGTGGLPRILGSIKLTGWSHAVGNIWVSDVQTTDPSRGAPHDGSQSGSGGYPGGAWFEELDGSVTWGNQEKYIDSPGDFAELTGEYDWGWYDGHIYVFSTVDPGIAYAAMQASQRQYAVGMVDNNPKEHIIIDGLELLFTQSKGFYAGYPAREAHDLTIRNCHVGYVGITGSYSMAEWATYKSETGWDATSPPPADPLFVDAPGGDLHLGAGSTAIGAGEVVPGVATDYAGNPRSVPPSLGALRYGLWDALFSDDFESGDPDAWSTVVP
jgi:hypothetical protein